MSDFLIRDGKLTKHGMSYVLWASLRLSQARTGDEWWIYAAPDVSEMMAYIRWETRER